VCLNGLLWWDLSESALQRVDTDMSDSTEISTPEQRFAGFLDEFEPSIVALTQAVLAKMRARLPGALEMVYDNYNFLVIGFGASERPSEAICRSW